MKKIIAMVAMAAFLGGMTVNAYGQDGDKKKTTTTKKAEKKKCDKKTCCKKGTEKKK